MWSVNSSQPWFVWDVGEPSSTVKTELSSNTPCLAQSERSVFVLAFPVSDSSSLKIFFKDGGVLIPSFTEKDNPWAWDRLWFIFLRKKRWEFYPSVRFKKGVKFFFPGWFNVEIHYLYNNKRPMKWDVINLYSILWFHVLH